MSGKWWIEESAGGSSVTPIDNRVPLRVIGLGDSITRFGGGVGALACWQTGGAMSYFGLGKGGDTSALVIARMTQMAAYKPRIVILQIGTNDWPIGGIPATGTVSTETNINTILDYIESIGAKPVLITVPPQNSYPTQTEAVNAVIEKIAYKRNILLSKRWAELGASGVWSYGSGYSGDTIHPKMSTLASEANKLLADLRQAGLVPPSAPLTVRTSQGNGIFNNACFAAVVGDVATGCTIYANATPSIVPNGTKGNAQKVTLTGFGGGLEVQLGACGANKLYHSTIKIKATAPADTDLNFGVNTTFTARYYHQTGGGSSFFVPKGTSITLTFADLFAANWTGNCTIQITNNILACIGGTFEVSDAQLWDAAAIGMEPTGVLTDDGTALHGLRGFA